MAHEPSPSWQELLDLIAMLDGGAYDDVSVTFGDVSVQLSRTGSIAAAAAPARPTADASPGPVAPSSRPAVDTAAGPAITAPMLGVFYRRPAPGAAPFVEPGDAVDADTTIGIIEIMKLMNPVVAGVAGVIAAFEAEDGAPVQFGQVLARLEA